MLRVFVDEVFGYLVRTRGDRGLTEAKAGSVTFVQRADQAVRLNVHFHLVALDGVYSGGQRSRPAFHEAPAPDREDLETILRLLVRRVRRVLSRRGLLLEDPGTSEAAPPSAIEACFAQAQQRLPRVVVDDEGNVRPSRPDPFERYLAALAKQSKLATEVDGFNLHAGVRVEADDDRGREALCRYGARPPFALERLGELADGRLSYALKKKRKNGQTHLVMTPLQLLARLSAIIPPPYVHAVRFHGVLAAASPLRAAIVPARARRRSGRAHERGAADTTDEGPAAAAKIPWAELLRHVYQADALACSRCGGRLEWIALITQPHVVRRILDHLNLPAGRPTVAPARDPPDG